MYSAVHWDNKNYFKATGLVFVKHSYFIGSLNLDVVFQKFHCVAWSPKSLSAKVAWCNFVRSWGSCFWTWQLILGFCSSQGIFQSDHCLSKLRAGLTFTTSEWRYWLMRGRSETMDIGPHSGDRGLLIEKMPYDGEHQRLVSTEIISWPNRPLFSMCLWALANHLNPLSPEWAAYFSKCLSFVLARHPDFRWEGEERGSEVERRAAVSSWSMSDYPVWLGNPYMGQIFPGGTVCGGKMGRERLCGTSESSLCFKEVMCDFVVTPVDTGQMRAEVGTQNTIAFRV